MSKIKGDAITSYKIGNFTKNAIKNFEENIVSQTNYLEKINYGVKDKNKNNNLI